MWTASDFSAVGAIQQRRRDQHSHDSPELAVASVVIVDPEPLLQRGLTAILEQSGRLRVIGLEVDGQRALPLILDLEPDLVIVGFVLHGMNGLELARAIRNKLPQIHIIAMCAQQEAFCAERALRYGAHGLVMRHDEPEDILNAVEAVLRGDISITRPILNELFGSIANAVHPLIPSPPDVLSNREMELFEMMGRGLDLKTIAIKIGVTQKTAASYRTRVKDKLNLCSTLELMRRATQWSSPERICYSGPGCPDRIFTEDGPQNIALHGAGTNA